MFTHLLIFMLLLHCNTNASDVCELKFTYLLSEKATTRRGRILSQTNTSWTAYCNEDFVTLQLANVLWMMRITYLYFFFLGFYYLVNKDDHMIVAHMASVQASCQMFWATFVPVECHPCQTLWKMACGHNIQKCLWSLTVGLAVLLLTSDGGKPDVSFECARSCAGVVRWKLKPELQVSCWTWNEWRPVLWSGVGSRALLEVL